MYLWKVDLLVNDFKSKKVSQKEEFKYILLFTIVMTLAFDPVLYIGFNYNYYDTLSSVLILGISIFGIYYCYKINSSGDDRDFIIRVMCIGLPVIIRVMAVMILVLIISEAMEVIFLNPEFIDQENIENTPVQVALMSVFISAYYWYLSTKIKAVSSGNA